MSDEVFLGGKHYVSSKRAADTSGYARDYIGQLARAGLIDAQRVGGLWYVSMESLGAYQRNAESQVPNIPPQKQGNDLDTVVNFDGKEYVSASRAAKITSYNQDYIGQLARGGKILSRQIGNRWYVERNGLLAHKAEKDRLLASVQAESLGIHIPKPLQDASGATHAAPGPMFTYIREDNALMPVMRKVEQAESSPSEISRPMPAHTIPIRVLKMDARRVAQYDVPRQRRMRSPRMTIFKATTAATALTFVIVLSYGFVTLKQNSLYTFNTDSGSKILHSNAFTASAANAISSLGDILERWIAPEITYIRSK
jgi:hypothetical protein